MQAFYWVSHHPSLIGWYDLKYLPSHILLQKHDFWTTAIGFKVLYVKVFLLVESNAVLYSCQHLQPTVAKYLNTDWHACWLTIFTSYGGGTSLTSSLKPSRSFTKTWSPYFILFYCWKVTILTGLVTQSLNPKTETEEARIFDQPKRT